VITPTPEDEAALDATKAPLMEHLLELRTRLIWSVVSFGICFGICFAFARQIFLKRFERREILGEHGVLPLDARLDHPRGTFARLARDHPEVVRAVFRLGS